MASHKWVQDVTWLNASKQHGTSRNFSSQKANANENCYCWLGIRDAGDLAVAVRSSSWAWELLHLPHGTAFSSVRKFLLQSLYGGVCIESMCLFAYNLPAFSLQGLSHSHGSRLQWQFLDNMITSYFVSLIISPLQLVISIFFPGACRRRYCEAQVSLDGSWFSQVLKVITWSMTRAWKRFAPVTTALPAEAPIVLRLEVSGQNL